MFNKEEILQYISEINEFENRGFEINDFNIHNLINNDNSFNSDILILRVSYYDKNFVGGGACKEHFFDFHPSKFLKYIRNEKITKIISSF